MVAPDFGKLKDRETLSSTPTWKPNDGENIIRVLATSKEQVDAAHGGGGEVPDKIATYFRSHFLPLGDELHVFRCRRDYDERCPACNFYWANKDNEDLRSDVAAKKLIDAFNNSQRFLMNIMDMSNPDKGVQPYECGPMVRNKILKLISSARWGDCLDPGEEGRAFIVTKGRDPRSKRVTYEVEPDPEKSSILHFLEDGWLDGLDGLEQYICQDKTEDQIQALVDTARQQLGWDVPPTPQPASAPVAQPTAPAPAPAPAPTPEPEEPKAAAAAPPPAVEVTADAEPDAAPEEDTTDAPHPDGCRCVECRLNAVVEK